MDERKLVCAYCSKIVIGRYSASRKFCSASCVSAQKRARDRNIKINLACHYCGELLSHYHSSTFAKYCNRSCFFADVRNRSCHNVGRVSHVIELLDAGMPAIEIADQCGVSRQRVYQVLHKYRPELKYKRMVRICQECGCEYTGRGQKYCSRNCFGLAKSKSINGMRHCSMCGEAKPLSAYYQRESGQFYGRCRTCHNELIMRRYKERFAAGDPVLLQQRRDASKRCYERKKAKSAYGQP